MGMIKNLLDLIINEDGTEFTEYAIISGLIVVISLIAITGIAAWVNGMLQTLYGSLSS
jgi:Flp pilus assembly pilin Flp